MGAGSTGLGEAGPQLCDAVGTRIPTSSRERSPYETTDFSPHGSSCSTWQDLLSWC